MTTSSPWLGREGQDWTLTDITARRFGICRDRAESYDLISYRVQPAPFALPSRKPDVVEAEETNYQVSLPTARITTKYKTCPDKGPSRGAPDHMGVAAGGTPSTRPQ
ncbi:hypothetical protein CCM_02026 [Cordyceps militaris CM01]|uniref:Uncharacterized protein n=1 Tax=Cordyceps militaris (strain CM01) TaxID=983644 RepID=G3JC92_CORMM|nr:uncharacterized protein CCM_02026 [Cordyceps militaris CM01]EGX93757.1 hypothetical protein CCM_02026 [Cordyceps militaris CM01]